MALRLLIALLLSISVALSQGPQRAPSREGPHLLNYVNEFRETLKESTAAGYQYWFVDRSKLDGETLKLSVVRPHTSTHPPHRHPESEFFFLLEGTAQFTLGADTVTVRPYASFVVPPGLLHSIRNAGEGELKYLVIKKYGPVPFLKESPHPPTPFDTASFQDGSHHWYAITEEEREIVPEPGQQRHPSAAIREIAENILLYQRTNGGWPKNYDMRAILTPAQRSALGKSADELNTTIDNGATHSQIEFLAHAADRLNDVRYRQSALRGLDYLLTAQYANGGWPQFFPDTSSYRKYITFNDGAMIGVMNLLHRILRNESHYRFVDSARRERIRDAFRRGIDCILRTQIVQGGSRTGWCQQHDNVDFRPRSARTFEPAAVTGMESAEVVRFLMRLEGPPPGVIDAVQGAIRWFVRSRLAGIRIEEFDAPEMKFQYHATARDRRVVADPAAPPIWARFYALGSNRPLFCNRDGVPVFTLAEVERERRTGYAWYTEAPAALLKEYPGWRRKHRVNNDALAP